LLRPPYAPIAANSQPEPTYRAGPLAASGGAAGGVCDVSGAGVVSGGLLAASA